MTGLWPSTWNPSHRVAFEGRYIHAARTGRECVREPNDSEDPWNWKTTSCCLQNTEPPPSTSPLHRGCEGERRVCAEPIAWRFSAKSQGPVLRTRHSAARKPGERESGWSERLEGCSNPCSACRTRISFQREKGDEKPAIMGRRRLRLTQVSFDSCTTAIGPLTKQDIANASSSI